MAQRNAQVSFLGFFRVEGVGNETGVFENKKPGFQGRVTVFTRNVSSVSFPIFRSVILRYFNQGTVPPSFHDFFLE